MDDYDRRAARGVAGKNHFFSLSDFTANFISILALEFKE